MAETFKAKTTSFLTEWGAGMMPVVSLQFPFNSCISSHSTYSSSMTCPSLADNSDFFRNACGGLLGLFSPGRRCACGNSDTWGRTTCRMACACTPCSPRDRPSLSCLPLKKKRALSPSFRSEGGQRMKVFPVRYSVVEDGEHYCTFSTSLKPLIHCK